MVVLPGGSGDENVLIRALWWVMHIVGQGPENWRKTKIVVTEDLEVVIRGRRDGATYTDRYRFTRHGPAQIWQDD